MKMNKRFSDNALFKFVHRNHLVYNTCWEDPRIDRAALDLSAKDHVLVITSAGCNALDYVLAGAGHVHAVDMNPRQNAVLELKLAGIRHLEYETFFRLFGYGRLDEINEIYLRCLRRDLSPSAQAFWDGHLHYFEPRRHWNGYYYHGASGWLARICAMYMHVRPGLRKQIQAILEARTLHEQQDIYYGSLRSLFWSRLLRFLVRQKLMLALAGVPPSQQHQVESAYPGGVAEYLEHCIENVFARLPFQDNYFWRVYISGHYTPSCCPEYLKKENFLRLKEGLVDRIEIKTDTVTGFLKKHSGKISRFVLLDHLDWLNTYDSRLVEDEWQAIVDRATPDARVIWRSGSLRVDYIDPVQVSVEGKKHRMMDLLRYDHEKAKQLHEQDRVHMYGSFYIADLITV